MTDNSYISWRSMSDKALMEQIGEFVRHHRVQRNITQEKLAHDADISRSTLSLLERGEAVTLTTLIRVLRVLDLLHVMEAFRVRVPVSPIEMAKAEKRARRRAGGRRGESNADKSDW